MNFARSDRKKYSVVDICQDIRRKDDSCMLRLAEYEAAVRATAREAVKLGEVMVKQLDEYEANRAKTGPK